MMRARLIANLEALLQFGLAHRVRRGDPIATAAIAGLIAEGLEEYGDEQQRAAA